MSLPLLEVMRTTKYEGEIGDIDGAMVDLLRVVHVQINHCNTIDIFFIMQMWNNDGTATENNKRVWFCLMWNTLSSTSNKNKSSRQLHVGATEPDERERLFLFDVE